VGVTSKSAPTGSRLAWTAQGSYIQGVSATFTEPLPLEVVQLGNFQARIMRSLRAAIEDWDEVCSALGAWEALHLTSDEPGPAADQHRVWVRQLLDWGQLLRALTEQPGFPDPGLAARTNARLRHLQDKLAVWHGEMTPEREEQILRAAFP